MEQHASVIASTIDKGALVLITGVTSFLAGHTANQFLEAGYRVRGTVRDLEKAQWLYDLFDAKYGKGKFEAVVVTDMNEAGAFDDAVKDVDGVVHMASVATFSDNVDEVIPPTVKGALNILTSATKEPRIKSLVLTSSSAAALLPKPDQVINITKDSWNDEAVEAAKAGNADGFTVYAASKTEAERAFWKAVSEVNPPFQVVTVLPDTNFGPILEPGSENRASSASIAVSLFNGDTSAFNTPPQYFIDVRDTARLHVISLIDPSCNRERIFGFAEPFNWNDVLAIFRKQNPEKSFPDDVEGMGRDMSQIPNEDAELLLRKHYGKGWTSLADSIEANTATLK